MMYYKRAEKNLALVSDDIEKAEFAFKMAEIFYNLKQTYVSMSYAVQALETYQMYETYTVRKSNVNSLLQEIMMICSIQKEHCPT